MTFVGGLGEHGCRKKLSKIEHRLVLGRDVFLSFAQDDFQGSKTVNHLAFAASAARDMQTQVGLGNATAAKAGTLKSIFRRNTASAHAASTVSVCHVNGQNRVTNAGARYLKQSSGRQLGKRDMPTDAFVGIVPPRCAATGPAASVRNSAR